MEELQSLKEPILERKIILVKGYQHIFWRGLNVIKAIKIIGLANLNCQVVISGAHSSVMNYVKDKI
ncbi:MAG: hypothetical protein REI96_11380 [Flavobacterium nitrogenifigens]|uniref:hypothetical protein n=1 Tax=Flavobacterium nitrogenifigens TaxID=1617283 RepID=UPI000DADDE01|nr:hypothetical protein [Flavobacterium nitrogenifigens]KAF2325944.1 hypothetical protein DM397_22065 [Flavobacterium nitrogenifigens]MDQ8013043.1 hypothetical protein [Flavobacterium nitrogenifigens]